MFRCLLFFLLFLCTPAAAQPVFELSPDGLQAGHGVAQLDGLWRYLPGDDPAYAVPEFDDAGWRTVRSVFPSGSSEAQHWTGKQTVDDDMTFIVLKRKAVVSDLDVPAPETAGGTLLYREPARPAEA